ncbi:MAG TPA: hypothetical protein VGM05_17870, partial [Planctomycetaceae bacterium]
MTDRKKPGWTFWTTVVLLSSPVLYVLSFGPACWWFSPRDPLDLGYSAFQYCRVPRVRFHQPFESGHQSRLLLLARLPTTSHSPLAIRRKRIRVLELKDPIANRSIGNPRGDSNRSDSTSPQGQRFGGGPTSP